jgi:cytochrome b
MTGMPGEIESLRRAAVPVWDGVVRLVHWMFVALLIVLVSTGLAKGDWLLWHMRAGQLLLALVIIRIAWGFVGSHNARFSTFVRGPRAALAYARSIVRPPHQLHASHNPLGGWMVVALLVALLVQSVLGLFTNDDVLWEGPLTKWVSKATSDELSSLHRRFWWLLVALAATHVIAAVAYLVVLRENLIYAMVTGRKFLPPGVASPRGEEASSVRAIVAAILCAAAVWLVIYRL